MNRADSFYIVLQIQRRSKHTVNSKASLKRGPYGHIIWSIPRCLMYVIFRYIYPQDYPNVGKWAIHWASGIPGISFYVGSVRYVVVGRSSPSLICGWFCAGLSTQWPKKNTWQLSRSSNVGKEQDEFFKDVRSGWCVKFLEELWSIYHIWWGQSSNVFTAWIPWRWWYNWSCKVRPLHHQGWLHSKPKLSWKLQPDAQKHGIQQYGRARRWKIECFHFIILLVDTQYVGIL